VDYQTFLSRVIDDGIVAVEKDYAGDSPAKSLKREGAIKGFEECRGKTPEELVELKTQTGAKVNEAYRDQAEDYWYWRCRDAEVEWVCNVVSAMLVNEGRKTLLPYLPTANGAMKAASILGVAA